MNNKQLLLLLVQVCMCFVLKGYSLHEINAFTFITIKKFQTALTLYTRNYYMIEYDKMLLSHVRTHVQLFFLHVYPILL